MSLLFFSFESVSLIVSINVSPCQQNPSFACSILMYSRKTVLESSKIFVEHARTLLIYLNPDLIAVRLLQQARLSQTRFNIKGCSYLENCLKKRKRDDYPRSLGWGGLKSLTRFGHSLFFSSVKKTKGSSAYSGSTYLLGASERCNAGFKDFMTLTWPWLFPMKKKRRQKNN